MVLMLVIPAYSFPRHVYLLFCTHMMCLRWASPLPGSGSVPVSIDLWKITVKLGAIWLAHSLRIRLGMLFLTNLCLPLEQFFYTIFSGFMYGSWLCSRNTTPNWQQKEFVVCFMNLSTWTLCLSIISIITCGVIWTPSSQVASKSKTRKYSKGCGLTDLMSGVVSFVLDAIFKVENTEMFCFKILCTNGFTIFHDCLNIEHMETTAYFYFRFHNYHFRYDHVTVNLHLGRIQHQ